METFTIEVLVRKNSNEIYRLVEVEAGSEAEALLLAYDEVSEVYASDGVEITPLYVVND